MIYQVKDPQGNIHEIEGPEGASPDEVMKQAQSLMPSNSWTGEPVDTQGLSTLSPLEQIERQRTQSPGALATDPTVSDYMNITGAGGLAKTGLKLGARAIGKGLNAMPFTKNIVSAIGDTADDMLLKGLGTRAAQSRQIGGIEEAREAAKIGRRAGADDIFSTERGSREALGKLIKTEGEKIGALRKEAGKAPTDIYQQVEKELMKKYNPLKPDVYSAGKPKVELGLNTIKNVAAEEIPTHANIAKGITDLNTFAVGEKLIQPNTPLAQVANKMSAASNAGIVQSLGPIKGKEYLDALKTESGAFHLKPFIERGAEREALSRGGGNIISGLIQKAADAGGYRAASKGLNIVHEAMSTPAELKASIASKGFMAQELEDYLKKKYER